MKNLLDYFIKLSPILLLLLFSNIAGAEEDIENLRKEILLSENDTVKVDKLIELVVIFYNL
ncbi:MAG: hypothetical protein KAH25_02160, partial [Bacteroidales bacterium]|nr:hypothetical protein [Bacteroidales bacterium]